MSINRIREILYSALDRMVPNVKEKFYDKAKSAIDRALEEYSTGLISDRNLYYEILGMMYEYLIPLTPRDIKELKELLKVD